MKKNKIFSVLKIIVSFLAGIVFAFMLMKSFQIDSGIVGTFADNGVEDQVVISFNQSGKYTIYHGGKKFDKGSYDNSDKNFFVLYSDSYKKGDKNGDKSGGLFLINKVGHLFLPALSSNTITLKKDSDVPTYFK
ncbi:hypothetical protein [Xylocopilactobacillus apis]|uniref:Uncharacterized protein n=1 Tax=Xylocopilactobacillus apis TaxID=2932183 RepID=A0AAU9CWW5_9LACO|nr:hypothetical protein [Xylocopilactobacillus apis]BDR55783.1 hypothetical protein KIMC2_03450 [Xylocopilactobacillus apis]